MTDTTRIGVQLGAHGAGPFGRRPEEDLPGVLAIVAAEGYDGAEVHLNVMSDGASAVRAAFDETGLVVAGLHVFDEDVSDAEGRRHVLAAARGIGAPRVLLTAHTLLRAGADTAAFREVAQLLEALVVDAAPIAVYHHPHDVDFRPLPDDPARCGLDVVLAEAPRVSVALDLYWAHMGGAEPAAMVRRLRERCDYVHVRDGVGRRTTPLGDGEVALDAALAELRDAATAPGWLVYEDATPRLPPIASCRAARSFLAARGFGARSLLSGSRQ